MRRSTFTFGLKVSAANFKGRIRRPCDLQSARMGREQTREESDEQRLLRHLLNHYEKAVRPVRNASNTVVVKMGREESGANNKCMAGSNDYTVGSTHSRAVLYYDGTVFWPPPTQLRSTCKIDVTYFPFDSQHCAIKFGSWTYHGFQVDITNRSANVDLSNYVESGEFDLVRVFQKRQVVKYTCCPEPYPDVTFYIHIRRKTLYYLYNVVFPCLMMSVLTLLVFVLPPDSSEKIALGITVLLAFSVFVLAIAEKMPETSDSMPLIGIYLTIVMLITSISVVMTVMVLNFHHRGPFDRPVPEWVRVLVLQKLRTLLKMHLQYPTSRSGNLLLPNDQFHKIRSRNIINLKSYHQLEDQLLWLQETEFITVDGCLTTRRTKRSIDLQVRLHRILQMLLTRQETNDLYETLAIEWREVARVIDRLLFWVFLACTVVISVILLLIIPIMHRSSDELVDLNSY
uniref:Uncharacterized protein n=1 Tax=Setaria digitata TaxID=48799 RepID=A0A915PPN4_9BILA